jgi:hypothetical protein
MLEKVFLKIKIMKLYRQVNPKTNKLYPLRVLKKIVRNVFLLISCELGERLISKKLR